ncbi:MAG: DegV family protein [Lachnospiraceae bacterium]|nr:DegV family protein [Lachnospiraceae bacterium]
MSYKIIMDSCGELLENMKNDPRFEIVPLTLMVGEETFIDDETFQQKEYLEKVAACEECARTACPSPDSFMRAYETDADDVYVITLSSPLSGSYNSACLGKHLYEETGKKKNIHVIDSRSASIGQTNIALQIMDYYEQGMSFEQICPLIDRFRDEIKTYFVLDNLETLRKNGRLSQIKSIVASTLSIKPYMSANDEGEIIQLGQCIGIRKAIQKMVDYIVANTPDMASKRLLISHCNCLQRAEFVKKLMLERGCFREIIISGMAGVSTTYSNDGGIIVNI